VVRPEARVAWIRGNLVFETREEAKLYLFEHIEIFYTGSATRPFRAT
jgi:hypothetical protein